MKKYTRISLEEREMYYYCENGNAKIVEDIQTKMFYTMGQMEYYLGVESTSSFSESLKDKIEPFKCNDLGVYMSVGNYNQNTYMFKGCRRGGL